MDNKKRLPDNPRGGVWGEKVRTFWESIQEKISPGDRIGLVILLILVDKFEQKPSVHLGDQIRLLAKEYDLVTEVVACLGLTPSGAQLKSSRSTRLQSVRLRRQC